MTEKSSVVWNNNKNSTLSEELMIKSVLSEFRSDYLINDSITRRGSIVVLYDTTPYNNTPH